MAKICFEVLVFLTPFWGVGHVRIAFSSVPSIGPSLTPPPPPTHTHPHPFFNSSMEATWRIRWCVQSPLSVLSADHFEEATRLPSIFTLIVLNKADDT